MAAFGAARVGRTAKLAGARPQRHLLRRPGPERPRDDARERQRPDPPSRPMPRPSSTCCGAIGCPSTTRRRPRTTFRRSGDRPPRSCWSPTRPSAMPRSPADWPMRRAFGAWSRRRWRRTRGRASSSSFTRRYPAAASGAISPRWRCRRAARAVPAGQPVGAAGAGGQGVHGLQPAGLRGPHGGAPGGVLRHAVLCRLGPDGRQGELSPADNRVSLATLVHAAFFGYCRYLDAWRRHETDVFTAADQLLFLRQRFLANSRPVTGFRITAWKRRAVRAFLDGPGPVGFTRNLEAAIAKARAQDGAVAAWGAAAGRIAGKVREAGVDLMTIEDGFLRSVGAGRQLHAGAVLCLRQVRHLLRPLAAQRPRGHSAIDPVRCRPRRAGKGADRHPDRATAHQVQPRCRGHCVAAPGPAGRSCWSPARWPTTPRCALAGRTFTRRSRWSRGAPTLPC
jgi:hypothetical protein